MSDYRWGALTSARPKLGWRSAPRASPRVEFVSAFPEQADFAAPMVTTTDHEAHLLGGIPDLNDRVRAGLVKVGFSDRDLETLLVIAQSEETVARYFAGSWLYALR